MVDLSRRSILTMLGGIGAFLGVPFKTAFSALSAPNEAKAQSLLAQVQQAIDAIPAEILERDLDGAYAQVFEQRQSTRAVELTVHVRYPALAAFKNGNVVRVRDTPDEDDYGPRWLYNASTYELGLAFAVVADGDPRAASPPSMVELLLPHGGKWTAPGVYSFLHMKTAICQPWPLFALPMAIAELTRVFRHAREWDAAHVLNNGTTYDATVGGDGVSLISANHPWDKGVWANTFGDAVPPAPSGWGSTYRPLDHVSFDAAYQGIANFVDDGGLRISVRPIALVVSSADADLGQRLAQSRGIPCIVWDYLTPGAWFIKTSADGLTWFKRSPFELDVWHDHMTDVVWVKGYERRCFQYHDPRAVFGSIPPLHLRA